MAGKTIIDLGVGAGRTLARASDGSIYGWGYNVNGSVGAISILGGMAMLPASVGVLPETASVTLGTDPGTDLRLTATVSTLEIRGLEPQTEYEIAVVASNDSGVSATATAPLTTAPDKVLASLSLTPEASTVVQGGAATYAASGANAAGEPLPVGIANVALSSTALEGTVDGATVTFPTSGTREISATISGLSATVTVTVSPRYAVTWNENWPGASAPTTEFVEAEQLTELPDPSAAGWVIAEWNTRANGSGDTVDLDAELSSVAAGPNLTLYAIWERRTLDVTLSSGAATSGDNVTLRSDVSTDVVRGLTVTFPTASPHVITATIDDVRASVQIEVQPAAPAPQVRHARCNRDHWRAPRWPRRGRRAPPGCCRCWADRSRRVQHARR